ncbi:MAG: peptidylprolyl isomerase [Cereibacter sphaeroides]|uniref:Parvulin-like PPIase n=1 Tax=Cereibacter sphaeroides TaxID=1063 RepID=A0A2W5S7F8_CERSP|nr:MAG: peptidylprolyl isomerase [Cereibacter sphaeroides]
MATSAGFGPILAMGLALSLALSAPARAEGENAETVVATVNGADITLGQMIALRSTLPAQYQQLEPDALYKGLLEQMIQQETLAQQYAGKMTKRDEIMLQNERRNYISSAELQGLVNGAVTDATIQAAYDAKYKDAAPATEYRASHILVATEQEANDLKAQIDGGADFAELAKTKSTDGSAASGGDLGWFKTGMMVKPFEDAVLTMKPGEVAGPVQTQFGYHLIKLVETRDAAPPALDEVREEIANEIQSKAIQDHVTALTEKATIVRTDGIDPKLLVDETILTK